MLFDEFGVRSVNMSHQSVFAFHSYSARSGVMVDLGERMDVVPLVDGYRVAAGVSRSHVGGAHLRHRIKHFLQVRSSVGVGAVLAVLLLLLLLLPLLLLGMSFILLLLLLLLLFLLLLLLLLLLAAAPAAAPAAGTVAVILLFFPHARLVE